MERRSIVVYFNNVDELSKFLKKNNLPPLTEYDQGIFESMGFCVKNLNKNLLFFVNESYIKELEKYNMSPENVLEFIKSSYEFAQDDLSNYIKRISSKI